MFAFIQLIALLCALRTAPPIITPDSMGDFKFDINCKFTDHTIKEGDKPTRPTGTVLVQVIFDAKKGPRIEDMASATLNIRDGDKLLLSARIETGSTSKIVMVQFSIHKDLIPHAQVVLRDNKEGSSGLGYPIDIDAFYRAR